jgi:hypothetical protein
MVFGTGTEPMMVAMLLLVLLLSEVLTTLLAIVIVSVILDVIMSATQQVGNKTGELRSAGVALPRSDQSWSRADLRKAGIVIRTESI